MKIFSPIRRIQMRYFILPALVCFSLTATSDGQTLDLKHPFEPYEKYYSEALSGSDIFSRYVEANKVLWTHRVAYGEAGSLKLIYNVHQPSGSRFFSGEYRISGVAVEDCVNLKLPKGELVRAQLINGNDYYVFHEGDGWNLYTDYVFRGAGGSLSHHFERFLNQFYNRTLPNEFFKIVGFHVKSHQRYIEKYVVDPPQNSAVDVLGRSLVFLEGFNSNPLIIHEFQALPAYAYPRKGAWSEVTFDERRMVLTEIKYFNSEKKLEAISKVEFENEDAYIPDVPNDVRQKNSFDVISSGVARLLRPKNEENEKHLANNVFGLAVRRVDGDWTVRRVIAGSPATNLGFQVGDAILSIGGTSLEDITELDEVGAMLKTGHAIMVRRANERIALQLDQKKMD